VSSAILYLAIIAIWACVLIPRWLRHDSARGSSHSSPAPIPASGDTASADVSPDEDEDLSPAEEDDSPREHDDTPPTLTREESRRRMMAARRRLLGMLIALEVAAIGLAMMGLAALWVVIPPSVMFGGYLLLLREAAHADAEQARREEEAAWARARAQERARARAEAGRRATAATAAPVAPARPVAGFDDSGPGRDFAPGLAGKYTASNAEVVPVPEPAGEDFYDQYTQNRLRAVGD